MRGKISDLILLLYLVPSIGVFLSFFITVFTEKAKIGKRKYKYFWMKMILIVYFVTPVLMLATFIENRKVEYIWIGGDFDYMRGYKNSVLYYDYLERKEFLVLEVFFLVWIIGGAAFVIRDLYSKIQLKKLQKISLLQVDKEFIAMKKRVMIELGIKQEIPVYRSDLLQSSFITGIWKPVIYLPQQEISEEEQYCILRHELIHYKRRDVWYRKLLLIIRGIYWVNPLVYFYYKDFLDSCELACDEEALKNQGKEIVISYARTIYRMSILGSEFQNGVGFSSKSMCERRVKAIMNRNYIQKKFLVVLLSGVMVFLFPITSYAAVESAVQVQTKLGYVLREIYTPSMIVDWSLDFVEATEFTPDSSEITVVRSLEGMARGNTTISCTVKGRYIVGTLELSKGDQVKFRGISSENDTDEFKVGISRNGIDKKAVAVDGSVSHTFTIEESGLYDIFIESEETISITGTITIK